mmetsp:Transcript_28256/g.30865  ORF Transcript_28256/g.30865 Transcript_28256/m.30865 type:complete len:187 (+) Transcript_28256:7-567(+)
MNILAQQAPFGDEQALIELFTHMAGNQYVFLRKSKQIYEHSDHYIKFLAREIEQYLPEYRSDFEQSPKYKTYQSWIKLVLLERLPHQALKNVVLISDKQEIRNLSPENKAYRKKFSDAVSGVMRKLKKYIYEDCRQYRQCILCSKNIDWLLVMCVGCKTCFHVGCLKRFGKRCSPIVPFRKMTSPY